ncbi:sigma-54-dependent transcriptional regulator [Pseudomonadota bacterium]
MQLLERPCVALVEDDPVMGESLVQRLEIEGFDVNWWSTGQDALEGLENLRPDLLISDIRLPDMNGEEVFHRAMPKLGVTPVMFITAFADIDQAVQLIRAGAVDYVTKPFDMDDFLGRVDELLNHPMVGDGDGNPVGALGLSQAMMDVEKVLKRVSNIDSTVLLTGESGVGKEVAARYLHNISNRDEKPFVALNCAAIPANLLESELFGHEAGAFTDARSRHEGYAERAGDGILFLDEISELPIDLQAKLLRLLQERSFNRVGGKDSIAFPARIITATNVDLAERVRDGRFREDLFYRINVIHIDIPALSKRKEDILPLLRQYVMSYVEAFSSPIRGLTSLAEEAALEHLWPGNVRELRNRVERAVALCEDVWIGAKDLFPELCCTTEEADDGVSSLSDIRDDAERRHILKVLQLNEGRMSDTAETLGVSRTTLWEKMRKLGLSDTALPH